VSALVALAAALLYGASDFLEALAARRMGSRASTTVGYVFATVAILALWPLASGTWAAAAVIAGAVAGVLCVVGLLAFYSALAIGPMSVLSPIIAVIGSVVPVATALVLGETLGPVTVIAVVVALVAAGLVSAERGEGRAISARALVLALTAGVGLGGSIVALDRAPGGSGLIPAVVEIGVGLVILAVVALIAGDRPWRQGRPALGFSAVGGVLLGAANAGIVIALSLGELAVVAVLIGLYPVVTVVLATVVTRERMSSIQGVGVVLALGASVTLAVTD
jgi:drug/metabolite transporter (DMT)-like permease